MLSSVVTWLENFFIPIKSAVIEHFKYGGNEVIKLNKIGCGNIFILLLLVALFLNIMAVIAVLKWEIKRILALMLFLLVLVNVVPIIGVYYFGVAFANNNQTMIYIN